MIEKITVSGVRGDGDYERRQRLYRPEDLYQMLERADFSILAVSASADGTVFEPTSSTAMWLFCQLRHQ
jgi:hypothetical protein